MEEILLAIALFVAISVVGGLLIRLLSRLEASLKLLHGEVLELTELMRSIDEELDEEGGKEDSPLEKYLREDVQFYRTRVLGEWPAPDRGGITGPGISSSVLVGPRPHPFPGPLKSPPLPDGFTTDPPASLPMDPIDMSGGYEGPLHGVVRSTSSPSSPRLVPPPKVLSPAVPPPGATDSEKASPSPSSSSSSAEIDRMSSLLHEWPEAKQFDPTQR